MPGINAYEFVILIVLALVILGPERLPQYARNLARWARQARDMAEDAKGRFKEETGTDFDDVDWKRYDPRQYDPRRIIRDALSNEYGEDLREARSAVTGTLDSARAATDPREVFRAKKDPGTRSSVPSGGVPPAATNRSSGAIAAGMAGAARNPAEAESASDAAHADAGAAHADAGAAGAVAAAESGVDAGSGRSSGSSAADQPDVVQVAPFDTEAT